MNEPLCRHADDFLDGFLSANQSKQFEQHLSECASCQRIIFQQRTMDEAARQYADEIVPPVGMAAHPMELPAPSTRNRRLIGAAIMIAASLLFMASVQLATRDIDDPKRFEKEPIATNEHRDAISNPSTKTQPIRSLSSSSHLAIVESEDADDITFVMLYPKFQFPEEQDHAQ